MCYWSSRRRAFSKNSPRSSEVAPSWWRHPATDGRTSSTVTAVLGEEEYPNGEREKGKLNVERGTTGIWPPSLLWWPLLLLLPRPPLPPPPPLAKSRYLVQLLSRSDRSLLSWLRLLAAIDDDDDDKSIRIKAFCFFVLRRIMWLHNKLPPSRRADLDLCCIDEVDDVVLKA